MIKRKLITLVKYSVLSVAAFLSVFPLLWMLISATNKSVDVIAGSLLPGAHLVENFRTLVERTDIFSALWNSLRNASVATIASLIVCSIAGYGFEIYHDRGKDFLMSVLLLSVMVPFVIMIPLFMMFGKANLLNTTAGLFCRQYLRLFSSSCSGRVPELFRKK